MSPTYNESSALEHFEHGNAIKIHNGTMLDFYPGLPHMTCLPAISHSWRKTEHKKTGGEGGEPLRVTVVQLTHRWMSLPGLLNTFTPYSTTQVDRRRREGGREGEKREQPLDTVDKLWTMKSKVNLFSVNKLSSSPAPSSSPSLPPMVVW